MQTYDNEEPTFDIYIYLEECGEEEYDQILEDIQLKYNNVVFAGSEYPDIIVSFKEILSYDEAKNIMFWFYDQFGDVDVDGWGANYDIDDRLLNVHNDWLEQKC